MCGEDGGVAGPGGPSGIERACSRVRAEVFCQWPTRLDSASACETTGHLPPTATLPDKLLRHPRNLITVEYFSSPILFTAGIHFPRVLLHNQDYPKVRPNPLNLLNAGDSFAGISSLISCSLLSPTRDLIA
jgi:hypothetical protein